MVDSINNSEQEGRLIKTLTDVEKGIYVDNWRLSSDDLKIGDGWYVEKRRLHGGFSDGVDVITVNNGKLSFIVVPTRGMGIWKGTYQGVFLGWDSCIKELVHPNFINLEARGGLGWLDGFNEWIVRCGLNSFGAPGKDIIKDNTGKEKEVMLNLHGRIANIPASMVEVKIGLKPPFELGVEGVVYERTMFGSNLKLTTSISTTLGSNSLKISDMIENLRGVSDEMQILYHCNFGSPFLEEGACFVAPIKRVAPRDVTASRNMDKFDIFSSPERGFVEQVYFMELLGDNEGRTKAMLVNKDKTKAVSVSFSLRNLPFFTLWKNTSAIEDGYVIGFEPGTGFPNMRQFERQQNRVIKLEPKERYCTEFTISIHLGKEEIQKINDEIGKIRGKTNPVICKEPIREFSPL
ncbi:MAG: aldose 1-epimerase family protein [Candidatus Bathyarchaeia archaeon]